MVGLDLVAASSQHSVVLVLVERHQDQVVVGLLIGLIELVLLGRNHIFLFVELYHARLELVGERPHALFRTLELTSQLDELVVGLV